MIKTRLLALGLSLALICSFAGCKNKEDVKNEDVENKTSSETVESKTEDSIVGTWVVTKTEIYDGPLKSMVEQIANTYYYIGAEYEFTEDGIFKNADGTITTNYSILDNNKIHMIAVVGNRSENVNDYELNGDELVMYGSYHSDNSNEILGHSSATYFKRK